ncbi:hypothetical protein ABTB87_18595 [Acinetobacter baumannii]
MNLLEVIAKNCGLAVVDSVTLGLGAAVKNSFYEIKDHVSQCNDALYLMQIKTFIETIDLDEGEVKDFFSKNPDNNRLGIELFKILESTYIEKQANLLAINFQNYLQGKYDKSQFNKYINLIKKIDAHIFEVINNDLQYPERLRGQSIPCEGLPKDATDYNKYWEFENLLVSDFKDLEVVGLIEEEIEETSVTYSSVVSPKIKRKRTRFYHNFYIDLYSKLK